MQEVNAAILLGASRFSPGSFSANESFLRSSVAFREYLCEKNPRGIGIEGPMLLDLFDSPSSAGDQMKAVAEFVDRLKVGSPETIRNLIVYYVGHGFFGNGGRDYFLALAATESDVRDATGLRFSSFGEVLRRRAKSYRVFYILDCCFAGEALNALQSGEEVVAELASAALRVEGRKLVLERPRRGSALLCAASRHEVTFAPQGKDLTMFSEALLGVLRDGDAELHPTMTLSDVGDLIWQRLRVLNSAKMQDLVRPVVYAPDQTDGDISKHVALFPNPAFSASVAVRTPLPELKVVAPAPIKKSRRRRKDSPTEKLTSESPQEARARAKRNRAAREARLIRKELEEAEYRRGRNWLLLIAGVVLIAVVALFVWLTRLLLSFIG
jgi:hypothetical protein